jgi:hypothetical protein
LRGSARALRGTFDATASPTATETGTIVGREKEKAERDRGGEEERL